MTNDLPMTISAPLSKAQKTALRNLIRRAAKAEIMPRFRRLDAGQIMEKKNPLDLVTEADEAAEAMIARGIQIAFPNALVVGEEGVAKTPELRDKIADAELAFLIDPVDGTWNFARGLALFGTMVAVTRFGRPVYGVIYDPIGNDVVEAEYEGDALFLPPRGAAQRLSTAAPKPLEEMIGYIHFKLMTEDAQTAVAAVFPRIARPDSLRCSAHEYRLVAQGHADFILSGQMTPWDHAAGALIVERAGGKVAMLDGSDYSAAISSGYLIAASSEDVWNTVADTFAMLKDFPPS